MPRWIQTTVPRWCHAGGTERLGCGLALVGAFMMVCRAPAGEPPLETQKPVRVPVQQARRVREFAPGVRIDWKGLVVEVEAKVVLRKGPLELLACSPQTREHESIFVVAARPSHIFQAMGLIGLEAGRPVRYDEQQGRLLAANGEPVEIKVRYRDRSGNRTVPVEKLLATLNGKRPPASVNWVFAGSRPIGDGLFGADLEGTVICVVDFDTALISLGSLHSADNEQLWLSANPDEIPPVGTACTLLIRSASKRPSSCRVVVRADGTLRLAGASISIGDLLKRCRPPEDRAETLAIVLRPEPDTPDQLVRSVVETLVRGGVDRRSIEVNKGQTPK